MIRQVRIKRFKQFRDEIVDLPGNVVLAGPNNTGKTTVLQAISAWDLAMRRWRELNDPHKHGVAYAKAPLARQAFAAVPLRSFELLWHDRKSDQAIEIGIKHAAGWDLTVEIVPESTEQVYVRPAAGAPAEVVRNANLSVVYVPPMSGIGTEEPVYQRPKLEHLLGQGKAGDVLRNLLLEASNSAVWNELKGRIGELFGYELLPPNAGGPHIIAEYVPAPGRKPLDISGAGSGFQQALMLLAFLYTRPSSVMLLDEPDAHLHVILQDAIYAMLKSVAVKSRSQLIAATHSEVIINSVEPSELCVFLGRPRILSTAVDRARLTEALSRLSQTDVLLADQVPGILYLEGPTDLQILREWARILKHPMHDVFSKQLFWKPNGGADCDLAKKHFDSLLALKPAMRGILLLDGDNNKNIPTSSITGSGLQRLRWTRYEIESYLLHPAAIERFIEKEAGAGAQSAINRRDALAYMEQQLTPAFMANPLGDFAFLEGIKASERLIPPILTAGGIHGVEKNRFYEVAALMQPGEIHPEVVKKLDLIQNGFGL